MSARSRATTGFAAGVVRPIVAVALGLITVFPFLWLVISAFRPEGTVFSKKIFSGRTAGGWTLDNFRYVLTEVPFERYLLNSFIVATTVTVVALVFHSMAAYALSRLRFFGRNVLFGLTVGTLLISVPVILVPLFLIVKELGMLNSYAGIIVPAIFNAFGIFLLRQFYLSVPRELEEAAIVDGNGYWGVYWHVMLPSSRGVLTALAIFFFLTNWNAFLWPLTVAQDPDLTVVQVAIASFQGQYSASWNYVMAAAVVAALPTVVLFLIFQRRIMDSLKTSGLK